MLQFLVVKLPPVFAPGLLPSFMTKNWGRACSNGVTSLPGEGTVVVFCWTWTDWGVWEIGVTRVLFWSPQREVSCLKHFHITMHSRTISPTMHSKLLLCVVKMALTTKTLHMQWADIESNLTLYVMVSVWWCEGMEILCEGLWWVGSVGGSGKVWGGGTFMAAICGIRPTKEPSKNWGNSSGWSSCLNSYYLPCLIVSVPDYSLRQHGCSPTLPPVHLTRPELWWRLKQCQHLSSSFPQRTWV